MDSLKHTQDRPAPVHAGFRQLSRWLEPPVFPGNDEKTAQARSVHVVGLYYGLALLAAAVLLVPALTQRRLETLTLNLSLLVFFAISRVLLARGQVRLSAAVLLASAWILFVAVSISSGGIFSPVIYGVLTVSVVVALLLEERIGYFFLGLSLLTSLALAGLQQSGAGLPQLITFPPLISWLLFAISLLFIHVFMRLVGRDLQTGLARARREVDARCQAEATLRQSEKRFRELFENTPVGLYRSLHSGQILDANRAALAMLGYTSFEQFARVKMLDLWARPEEWHAIEASAPTGDVLRFTFEMRRADGSTFWVDNISRVVRDEAGRPLYYDGSFRDITESRRAEEALRESEERFRSVIEQSYEGYLLSDEQGTVIEWNRAMEQLTGLRRQQVLGQPMWFVQNRLAAPERRRPEVPPSYQQVILGVLSSGQLADQRRLQQVAYHLPDGRQKWVQQAAFVITTARGYRLALVNRDITEWHLAQQALQEAEDQFRAVVQTANEGIVTINARQQISFWNAAAEKLFGYSSDEMLGQPIDAIMPQRYLQSRSSMIEALLSGRRQLPVGHTIEVSGTHRSGREFPLEMSFAGWTTSAGRFLTAIMRDITERKQRERQQRAIVTLSAALRTAPSRAEMLPVIVEQAAGLLTADTATVEIIDPYTGEAVTEAGVGAWQVLVGTRQRPGTGINALIAQTGQPYFTTDLQNDPNLTYHEWARQGIRGSAGVPLIAQEKLIGFLWIVYNYLDEPGRLDQLMANVAGIIIYIFATLMRDRYIFHIFQTKGPFPHQNSLVMYMCIFASLVLAYLLNRRDIAFPFWFLVFGMGGICIVFTLSRAGMAVFALSVAVIIAMSLGREFNPRTLAVILLLFAAGAAVLIKASGTIKERIETAPEESAQVRVLLARAAAKMANDKLLGIGLNNFGIKINPPYSYGDEIEHKASEGDVQNGLVETIYLMIAAETGWLNLGVFFLWIFFMYLLNLRNLKYYRSSPYRYICIGLTGGLTAIYLESALEWVLKQTNNAYQLMLVFAVIGAMRRWAKYPEGDAVENPAAPAVA